MLENLSDCQLFCSIKIDHPGCRMCVFDPTDGHIPKSQWKFITEPNYIVIFCMCSIHDITEKAVRNVGITETEVCRNKVYMRFTRVMETLRHQSIYRRKLEIKSPGLSFALLHLNMILKSI